mmetsp:Transcript_21763/g.51657  ORF Transcript_21763/g.51657 Transcript_21763/m.51657 type:complete len:137 (+) Transcript_21763:751-1161(+)
MKQRIGPLASLMRCGWTAGGSLKLLAFQYVRTYCVNYCFLFPKFCYYTMIYKRNKRSVGRKSRSNESMPTYVVTPGRSRRRCSRHTIEENTALVYDPIDAQQTRIWALVRQVAKKTVPVIAMQRLHEFHSNGMEWN